jgi:hypothetical protein
MRPRLLALSALLLAAAGTAPAQEAVLLRLGGAAGQVVHSRMVMTMYMRGGPFDAMGADTTQPTTRLRMFVTQTLDSVSGDTLSFHSVIDSVHAESPAMPQLAAMTERAFAASPTRSTIRMDSRGRFLAMDTGGINVLGAAVGAPLGGAGSGLGPAGPGYILPEHPVRVGESWTATTNVAGLPGGGAVTGHSEYRLERIEPRGSAGTAVILMSGAMSVTAQMSGAMSVTALGTPTEMPIAGIFHLDIAARRMTATAMTMAYATSNYFMSNELGTVTGRVEITSAELDDSAPPPPMIRRRVAAAPPRPAASVSPPQPGATPAAADEPEGVEASPAPGRFTVIRLGAPEGQLNALLLEHVRRARAAGRRPFLEFEADWCGPCRSLQRSLGDSRMVEAFDGTYIVRVNLDRWLARLAGTGFDPSAIPVFFELDDAGRSTGRKIDGGAWGEDIPENMAPPLKAFFHPGAATGR